MSVENNERSTLLRRGALPGLALPPAMLGKLEGQLYAEGGLLQQPTWPPTPEQATNYTNEIIDQLADGDEQRLITFAGQKVVGATTGFNDSNLRDAVYAGGICALSTFESRKLSVAPPKDIDQYLEEELAPITIAQVFEAVGQTKGDTVVTLEDALWAQKVRKRLEARGRPVDEAAVRRAIARRNQRAFDATQKLRKLLLPRAEPLKAVRDTDVMDDLQAATDELFYGLTVSFDESDMYRLVYAGMYSGIWKQVLENAGFMRPNQTLVIYEPTKHVVTVNGRVLQSSHSEDWVPGRTPEARFRKAMLAGAPYLQPGSFNEKVGVITYLEPMLPNGKRFRDVMPVAVMPNSSNYKQFDFGRFPILPPGRYDDDPEIRAGFQPNPSFEYFDSIANTKLQENPAFLWGAMYPPTQELALALYRMWRINTECRTAVTIATREAEGLTGSQLGDVSRTVRGQYSKEMTEAGERVIKELQRITAAMFKGV
jgi:hypothetical protein